jgi:hypothetical protein
MPRFWYPVEAETPAEAARELRRAVVEEGVDGERLLLATGEEHAPGPGENLALVNWSYHDGATVSGQWRLAVPNGWDTARLEAELRAAARTPEMRAWARQNGHEVNWGGTWSPRGTCRRGCATCRCPPADGYLVLPVEHDEALYDPDDEEEAGC